MSWPVVDRAPVQLPSLPGHDDALWTTLVELSDVRPGDWTLISDQMAFLHALEHDTAPPRVSTVLDILVNARIVSGAVGAFSADIEALGFELDGVSIEGVAHRSAAAPSASTGLRRAISTSTPDYRLIS